MDAQPYEGHGSTSPKKLEVLMMFVSFPFFFLSGCGLPFVSNFRFGSKTLGE